MIGHFADYGVTAERRTGNRMSILGVGLLLFQEAEAATIGLEEVWIENWDIIISTNPVLRRINVNCNASARKYTTML